MSTGYGDKNPNWKGGPSPRVCVVCSVTFMASYGRRDTARCCSRKCSAVLGTRESHKNHQPQAPKPGRMVVGPYTRVAPADVCGHITKKGRALCATCKPPTMASNVCTECGSKFDVYASAVEKYRTCSPECARLKRSREQQGELSHRWRGGVTSPDRVARNSWQVDAWRRAVMARDDYTCQCCGKRGGKMTADHVLPWSLFPTLRYEIENGRVLCRPCHSTMPTTGGRLGQLTAAIQNVTNQANDPRVFAMLAMLHQPVNLHHTSERAAMYAHGIGFRARSAEDVYREIPK